MRDRQRHGARLRAPLDVRRACALRPVSHVVRCPLFQPGRERYQGQMALNLLKLCVGVSTVEDMESWIAERHALAAKAGQSFELVHTTRMVPTRTEELLSGGSLYWVIRGEISARQKLLDIRPFVDDDGIRRCGLVLEPELVRLMPRPSRPFQGWRYLKAEDAPPDLSQTGKVIADMPEEMRRELMALGLL